MGIKVSDTLNIPKTYEHYIYFIGGRFDDVVSRWVKENFDYVSGVIGRNAIIVRGLNTQMDYELYEKNKPYTEGYCINKTNIVNIVASEYKQNYTECIEIVSQQARQKKKIEFPPIEPCLIVTDLNPDEILNTINNKVKWTYYFIPLKTFTEMELSNLFMIITGCIFSNDFQNLDGFLHNKFKDTHQNVGHFANNILELKPNIAGVGLNLNNLFGKILDYFSKRKNSNRQ